ncbi:MAG: YncE family protein [Candidatus Sulfotelmatobacter sp.]
MGPTGVAFDGANIWVTNAGDFPSTVSKLRAADGALLGTFTVGYGAQQMAFDGANVWVANLSGNNVTKLQASSGNVLGTFAVGTAPFGIAFDGTNLWVSNSSDNTITKLLASNGTILGTFAVGTNPRGVAFDGMNIWVTAYSGMRMGCIPHSASGGSAVVAASLGKSLARGAAVTPTDTAAHLQSAPTGIEIFEQLTPLHPAARFWMSQMS